MKKVKLFGRSIPLVVVIAVAVIATIGAAYAVNGYNIFDTSGIGNKPQPTNDDIRGTVTITEETTYYSTEMILTGVGEVNGNIHGVFRLTNTHIGTMDFTYTISTIPTTTGVTEPLKTGSMGNLPVGETYETDFNWTPTEVADYVIITTLTNITWN